MAVRALRRCLLVDNNGLARDKLRLHVTFITRHLFMGPFQGKVRLRLVVKDRRNPALRIVTIRAMSFPGLRKLAGMSILVAILANL